MRIKRALTLILAALVSFSGTVTAEDAERFFSVTSYLNGNINHTYVVTGDVSPTGTLVTFRSKERPEGPNEGKAFTLDGRVEAISTLWNMFVVYTSSPGENTYIFRDIDGAPAIAWHCNSRFAAEVGSNWAMCFKGQVYKGHQLLPKDASVYIYTKSGTYKKLVTVPYDKRYSAIVSRE